jgi:hypothetical protein
MSASSSERDAAITTANESYASARQYVEGIDVESMLRPNRVGIWSGKDLVIHIADWESEGARIIEDLAAGRPESWIPDGMDGNTFNEQRVADHSDMSLSEAMDLWESCHQKLVDAYRDTESDRENILFGLTREHYRGHYADFRHVKPFVPLSDEDREELLSTMDAAHHAFLELVASIDAADLLKENTIGIWSGKDLIAHLGHWQQAAIDLTRELEQDRPGKWPGEDGNNINEWNEARVEEMGDQDLDEIRAYQQERYEELRELIQTSSFATRSAGIGATEFHYGLHTEDFESLK